MQSKNKTLREEFDNTLSLTDRIFANELIIEKLIDKVDEQATDINNLQQDILALFFKVHENGK